MRESDITLCGHGSGTPRLIRMDTYLSQRYKQTVTKGGKTWHKGVVAVIRPVNITDDLRRAYVAKYSTILGRNLYSQAKRKFCYVPYADGKYYSDCSSSQTLTLAAIGMLMPSYNTEEMYHSSLFKKLNVDIKDGHIQNPDILRVGDMLLFAGADPTRDKCIGHVEGVFSIGEDKRSEIVEKYQKFLNDNYAQILKTANVGKLKIDGEYGEVTRAASVAVWKYMANKYYNAGLTVGNPHFYESSEKVAEDISNAVVAEHPTYGYILNGVLTGLGYPTVYSGTFTGATRTGLLKFQADRSISQTGRLSGKAWRELFRE